MFVFFPKPGTFSGLCLGIDCRYLLGPVGRLGIASAIPISAAFLVVDLIFTLTHCLRRLFAGIVLVYP